MAGDEATTQALSQISRDLRTIHETQVEHGKTEMLLRFRDAPVVTVMTDVTAYGINQQRGRYTWIEDRPPEKTHIIIPDILTPGVDSSR